MNKNKSEREKVISASWKMRSEEEKKIVCGMLSIYAKYRGEK